MQNIYSKIEGLTRTSQFWYWFSLLTLHLATFLGGYFAVQDKRFDILTMLVIGYLSAIFFGILYARSKEFRKDT